MSRRILLPAAVAVTVLSAAANQVPSHNTNPPPDLLAAQAAISRAMTIPSTFLLWPDGAPSALGTNAADSPTLTVFLPADSMPLRAAMVVCPGGGYRQLSPHEGELYAKWLSEHGMVAFVLKYRLGSDGYRHPAMWQDVSRALRTVRARAAEWSVDPHRIGVMGSSAGGHLASAALTHFVDGDPRSADIIERASSRPDLGVLCYPVISMDEHFAHRGSRENLLGTNPPAALVKLLSSELQVASNTPPCFVWSTADDKTVPVENSLRFAAALRAAQVPFALHIYEHGHHGQGLGAREWQPEKFLPWTCELERWLQQHGFIR